MAALGHQPAPDPKRAAAATRLLAAAMAADTAQATERLVGTLLTRAERSTKWTDAAFAAVQSLGDLGSIDSPEAVWLLSELCDVHVERVHENDPVMDQAMDEYIARRRAAEDEPESPALDQGDREILYAVMDRRTAELHAEFYRVRGEGALADMRLEEPEQFRALASEGERRFIRDKYTPFHDLNTAPDPAAVARVTERVIAMAAAETLPECFAAWHELNELLRPAPKGDELPPNIDASAIAAAQNLRSLGVITEREAAHLIDDGVSGTAWLAADGDRTCKRLQGAMDAIERAHGLKDGASFPEGEEPAEWLALDREYGRRYDGFTAVCLRRFGEHGLARLLVENPAEYHRMVDDFGVGVIWADR